MLPVIKFQLCHLSLSKVNDSLLPERTQSHGMLATSLLDTTKFKLIIFIKQSIQIKRPMDIDHIFIFTDNKGRIADELVSFGLTEGSSRVHQGQGTTNRTFSFENFFLEIVWVHNE